MDYATKSSKVHNRLPSMPDSSTTSALTPLLQDNGKLIIGQTS